MKVYVIMRVFYDGSMFNELMKVGRDLDKLKSEFNKLPMFSSAEVNDDGFESPKDEGSSHYYYEEFDV